MEEPPSFLCDAMLGGLSRWLRASGYDAEFEHGIDDGELVRRAQQTGRIFLSSDAGIFVRRLVRTGAARGLYVPRHLRPAEQAGFVLRELGLPVLDPRCMACGGALTEVPPEVARGEVPAAVLERNEALWRCLRCGKLLWKGKHWGGIARKVAIIAGGSLLLALAACGAREDLPGAQAAEPACPEGLLDCDGDPANACEVDPRSDPDHCGACGRSCRGAACVDGVCQRAILVAGIDPGCPVLDGDSLYVTDTGSGSVLRVPKELGEPQVLASAGGSPFWLAVRGGWVYWAAPPGLWRVPAAGGPAEMLAASNRPLGSTAAGEDRVYVADNQAFGSILAAPLGGGDLETFVEFTSLPTSLRVEGDALYWAEGSSVLGQIMKQPLSGGDPIVLAAGQDSVTFAALDDTHVYWSGFMGGGAVSRVPRDGGPVEIVVGDLSFPTGLALAADGIYLSLFGSLDVGAQDGSIARAPRTGGPPEILLGARDEPVCISVDDESIYWAELGARAVYKMAR